MRPTLFVLSLLFATLSCAAQDSVLHFVFTSDVHYGITRKHFRGEDSVPSYVVNRALIGAINELPGDKLPEDGGAGAGQAITHLDGVLITGDIANREEKGIQPAAASWQQFDEEYDHLLTIKDRHGRPSPIYLTPGNHDVSDAVGFWRKSQPPTDASSMAGIYNRMMDPARPRTASTYNYATDKIHCIKNIAGIQFVFLDVWPDSTDQAWMDAHLKGDKPAFLFTHSNPDVEARFFTNPNGDHGVNATDKFENLVPEVFRDGSSIKDSAVIEQQALVRFLGRHPEIKAYFHGHNNYTEFYEWNGLPCFRVDSPMKGKYSAKDERRLAFELITIDTRTRTMTVRECLWNKDPQHVQWGESRTITL